MGGNGTAMAGQWEHNGNTIGGNAAAMAGQHNGEKQWGWQW